MRQGEVIAGLVEPQLKIESAEALLTGNGEIVVDARRHPLAAVITQDCDLEGDYRARKSTPPNSGKMLPSIVLCEVHELELMRAKLPSDFGGAKRWKILKQNNEIRYHHLQAIPSECDRARTGLPALGVDFNRCFTMETGLIYKQLEVGAVRRFRDASSRTSSTSPRDSSRTMQGWHCPNLMVKMRSRIGSGVAANTSTGCTRTTE